MIHHENSFLEYVISDVFFCNALEIFLMLHSLFKEMVEPCTKLNGLGKSNSELNLKMKGHFFEINTEDERMCVVFGFFFKRRTSFVIFVNSVRLHDYKKLSRTCFSIVIITNTYIN